MLPFYRFIYDIGVHIYFLGIYVAQLFNSKARKSYQGRQSLFSRLETSLSNMGHSKPRVWIHCASLGEFEQARPVIEALRQDHHSFHIILTFFSPSGYDIRKDYEPADIVTYLPKDTPANAKRFVQLIQPDISIFVKYEFWFHFLHQLHLQKCPVLLISAIFQEGDIFFRWYGKLYREMLRLFDTIFVQDQHSVELLNTLNINHVVKSGDTRVERVYQLTKAPQSLELIPDFKGDQYLFIAGSTYKKEEEFLKKFMHQFPGKPIKYIIAPHEVDQKNIERLQTMLQSSNPLCYSKINKQNYKQTKVLIIDSIGLLAHLYQYGTICLVGGGFGSGIHNILEPAAFGLPVLFGPNYRGFKEAADLIQLKGGYSIQSYAEFRDQVIKLIENEAAYRQASQAGRNYIQKNTGATEKIIKKVAKF